MKNIDRFWACMDYGDFDHPPLFAENVWAETLALWRTQGLAADKEWTDYFEVKPLNYYWHGFNHNLLPAFERKVIEKTAEYTKYIDESGRTARVLANQPGMPEWLDYTVKDAASFEKVIDERLQVRFNERFAADYAKRVATITDPSFDGLVLPPAGNYFFTLDSLMGVATVSMMFYEAPELIHRAFDNLCEMCSLFMDKFLAETNGVVRAVGTGEDLSFKNGPFFSPDIFDEFFMPRYRRIMEIANNHGAEYYFIDTDGNFKLLIPQMLSLGPNIYCPVEVAAGMDPLAVRKEFGKGCRFLGGVDKRIVAEGRDEIKREMERLYPLMAEGGFVPIIDHSVPPTISWDNFRYYMETLLNLHERCARR